MRAAVLTSPKQFAVRELPPPEPGPTQVRIRLEGCGVCASNVPVWEGRPWFSYPLEPGAPGHEGWGVIDAVGRHVREVEPGDRVAALGCHAYSEFDVVEANEVVRLPRELRDVPFPGEPLGCAMNVFRRSDIQSSQAVAIIGIGFLGALLVRLAKNAGARVLAISRRPAALELAKQYGADEVYTLANPADVIGAIGKLTSETGGCDRVIEATGHQQPLDLASELVRVRGRLIIAGYHQDGPRQINMQQWNWRGIDVINAHERDQAVYVEGIRLAVKEVLSGRLDPTPLYTHRLPLERINDALELTRSRPGGFLKALVAMSRHDHARGSGPFDAQTQRCKGPQR